jgi:hypothetical protein
VLELSLAQWFYFLLLSQDFGSFDDILLAQPPDVSWPRLQDVAPVRNLRLFSMIRKLQRGEREIKEKKIDPGATLSVRFGLRLK